MLGMNTNITKHAFLNALFTALYVAAIASMVFYAGKIFADTEDIVLIPIGMLCLLVSSAALTGFLIFGRPVQWYLDGKKKEALSLLGWTLGFLFAITLVVFLILFIVARMH